MERVEFVVVRAPETSETATISGSDLMVEPVRRNSRPGASIDAKTFNLRDVGHVPGCEREYMEENQAFGPDDDSCSDSTVCSLEEGQLEQGGVEDDDDSEPDSSDPTLAAGTRSEEDDDDEEATAAADTDEDKVMENLAAEIGKAVHISMLKSIRKTAVLSQHSKKKTMHSMTRFRNSFLSLESAAEDEQDEDLRALLNFQI